MCDILTKITSLLLVLTFPSSISVKVSANAQPDVSAKSAVLYEPTTKTFLYEKNKDERLGMASTTKIMTALLAIEKLDPSKQIAIPKEAVGVEGSSVYLSENDTVSIEDLLYSVLLQSANDAAVALAIEVAGSIEAFAKMMNERAEKIGATDTSFANPHGLDSPNHFTTAHDLSLIADEALKNEIFKKICSTKSYSFLIGEKIRTVVNHNKLLWNCDGVFGVKTGYTRKCGRCLVSAAERDGITLICISLNAPNDWADHKALFDYGFNSLIKYNTSELSQTEFSIPVIDGTSTAVPAKITSPPLLILKKTEDKPTVKIYLKKYVVAPIIKNDVLGEAVYYSGEKIIGRCYIRATQTVKETKQRKYRLFDLF